MADTNINAHCSICGIGYHLCKTCSDQKIIKPWRTVTESIEHFKIYTVIHGYTISKNKEVARSELKKCDLTGLENFNPEIKIAIKEILEEPEKVKASSRKRKEHIETKFDKNEISE